MKTYLNRPVVKVLEFDNKGTWMAMRAAESYLFDNGYEYGSTCATMPLGFVKGEWNMPWKWKNMSAKERNSVDGVVIGDMREGPVTIIFFTPGS